MVTRIQINNDYLDVYYWHGKLSSLSEFMVLRKWFTHNQTKKIIAKSHWEEKTLREKYLYLKFYVKIKTLILLKRGLKR
jgi:hypothetical protein